MLAKTESNRLNDLPDEILLIILNYLFMTYTLHAVGMTNRRLYQLTKDSLFTLNQRLQHDIYLHDLKELAVSDQYIAYSKHTNQELHLINLAQQRQLILRNNNNRFNNPYHKLYLSPNQTYLVAIRQSGVLEIWQLQSGNLVKQFFQENMALLSNPPVGSFNNDITFSFISNDCIYQLNLADLSINSNQKIVRPAYWNSDKRHHDEELIYVKYNDPRKPTYIIRAQSGQVMYSDHAIVDSTLTSIYGIYSANNIPPILDYNSVHYLTGIQSKSLNLYLGTTLSKFVILKKLSDRAIKLPHYKTHYPLAAFSPDNRIVAYTNNQQSFIMINDLVNLVSKKQATIPGFKALRVTASHQIVAHYANRLLFFKPIDKAWYQKDSTAIALPSLEGHGVNEQKKIQATNNYIEEYKTKRGW